jgi:hypothetical protein
MSRSKVRNARWIPFAVLFGLLFVSGQARAARRTPSAQNGLSLPPQAQKIAPGVFYLGKSRDRGRPVEGYAYIRYKKDFAKPSGCNNDGRCQGWEDPSCSDCSGSPEPTETTCYGFLAKGAKWRTTEPYLVNADNSHGLAASFVSNNLELDIAKWEASTSADIFGPGEATSAALVADTARPDEKNEVYFGEISEPGAIAITIVWGIFRGPPTQRELVEWDQVYDQVDFDWSADCQAEDCAAKMDFENIATHELGHSAGLDDLYTNDCNQETMYGYASEGETKKRSLEPGDIFGISSLYAN